MAGDLIAASDQPPKSKPKPKPRPPSRRGRGPTPASWKPGQSGNPHGRPKHQLAFAERVRERVDPDLVIELALRVAHDETMPAAARLAALMPLVDRGWTKPPTTLEAHVTAERASNFDVSKLSLDEQRALLDTLRRAKSARDPQLPEPTVAVENRA